MSSIRKVLVQLGELVRVEEQQYLHAVGGDAAAPADDKKTVCLPLTASPLSPAVLCNRQSTMRT